MASWIVIRAALAQAQGFPIDVPQGKVAQEIDIYGAAQVLNRALGTAVGAPGETRRTTVSDGRDWYTISTFYAMPYPLVINADVFIAGRLHRFMVTDKIFYLGGSVEERRGSAKVTRLISHLGEIGKSFETTTHSRDGLKHSDVTRTFDGPDQTKTETVTKYVGGTTVTTPAGSRHHQVVYPKEVRKVHQTKSGETTGGSTKKRRDPATGEMISTVVKLLGKRGFTEMTYLPGGRIEVDHADGRHSSHQPHERGRTVRVTSPSGWRRTVWTTLTGKRVVWSGRPGRMKRYVLKRSRSGNHRH